MTRRTDRPFTQPIPMKWVVVSIVVFIVLYTAVNIFYRKPGPGHEPAVEMRDRVTSARLKEAGWERQTVDVSRPAGEPELGSRAPAQRGSIGLGLDIDGCFIEKPRLLGSVDKVAAPASISHGSDYPVYFTATVSDQRSQLGDVVLLRRGKDLVLVPSAEHLPGKGLLTRWPDASYAVTLPTANLPPGRYQVRVVASGPALRWEVEIR